MPVPTETFRSIRKLNIIFAASSAFFLLVTMWLILDDWYRPWRGYQQDARQWQAVLTADSLARTDTEQLKLELGQKEEEIRRLREAMSTDTLARLQRELAHLEKERIKVDLPAAIDKSKIVPLEQQLERALLENDAAQVALIQEKLDKARGEAEEKSRVSLAAIALSDRKKAEIAEYLKSEDEQKKELENLARELRILQDRLSKLDPRGLARWSEKGRNAPLVDWFNPSEKIEQVIVPGVRMELNFLTVETADACQTCHINIDKPEFAQGDLTRFLQRQLAKAGNQDVETIDEAVVAVDFWENAIAQLAWTGGDASVLPRFRQLQQASLIRINTSRAASEDELLKPLEIVAKLGEKPAATWTDEEARAWHEMLHKELDRIGQTAGRDKVGRRGWYEQRLLYVEDLQHLISQQIGEKEFGLLKSHFRSTMVAKFNEERKKRNLAPVSNSPAMLAHPNLGLFVDAESPHPLKSMGCSVCHEGSGQDTSFFHTAHTPRRIWVDVDSGATIAQFLLAQGEAYQGGIKDLKAKLRSDPMSLPKAPSVVPAPSERPDAPKKDSVVRVSTAAGAMVLAAATGETGAAGAAGTPGAGKTTHDHHLPISGQDVNLLTPDNPAPFAPEPYDHHEARIYLDPASNEWRVAVRQKTYWKKKYNWHAVHLIDWEKPMHAMEYVQSSCTKCHTGHYDLREEAPKVYEGRKLFAQVGCANCHQVDQILEHKDLKKVGPSLAHVKEKMSPQMLATWIWSPKAFRPASRMPHFFMLENNSSPADILRTRTEVAALTHYLLNAPAQSLEKIAILMREDGQLVAEREKETTPASRKFAIDKRRTEIAAQVETLKKAGIERYQPQLPPTMAKVKALTTETELIQAKLKDEATKAEDKPPLEARLAAIEGEMKEAKEKPMVGDVQRGRELFMGVPGAQIADGGIGCAACHSNLNETGQKWVTGDLMKREGLTSEKALAVYNQLNYNQKHTYVLQYTRDKLNRRGPELSGVGTKLLAGRTPEQAQAWLYDWLKNPTHYSSYTIMPSFRLSDQEAMDLTAYLLAQERPGATDDAPYEAVDFIAETKSQHNAMMLDVLAEKFGASSGDMASPEAKLMFLGKRLIMHYNCQSCHQINGYEDTASSAPQLNDWGLKDPHKLDFGYFEHAEERRRRTPTSVWKVLNEGLAADAAHVTAFKSDSDPTPDDTLELRTVAWEHIYADRREWATHKLHNTRLFDRGKYVVPHATETLDIATLKTPAAIKAAMTESAKRAYDKLKMPKFFLTDDEAQAIITYITSVRKPLVDPSLQQVADDAGKRATIGRQIAEKYNCYGCHNIEGNEVSIQSLFNMFDERGHYNGNNDGRLNAPPRLIGQGAKTQPDWTVHFLDNVHPLRPWLKVRMPSFHFANNDASGIADYFAGATQKDADRIAKVLAPIDAQIQRNDIRKKDMDIESARITERLAANEKVQGPSKLSENSVKALTNRQLQIEKQKTELDRWGEQPAIARSVERLKATAIRNDLAHPNTFDPRRATANDRLDALKESLAGIRFLHDVYQVPYPYPPLRLPDISEERFARGEALFTTAACAKCHALGDEDALFKLWKLENPNAGAPQPPVVPGDDYDDEPKPPAPAVPPTPPAAAAGGDDYDDEPGTVTPPAPAPVGPGWSAPNLRYSVRRIQPQWAEKWLQRSMIILPGTKMPNQWAGPSPMDSFFFAFPDEAKIEAHQKFYFTGPEQRQLILDYVYAAGLRNHTPGLWKLEGKPAPQVVLSEVFPPKPDEFELPKIAGTEAAAGPVVTGPVTAAVIKAKSDIVLHDGEAPYEGEAAHGHKTRIVGLIKLDGTRPRRNVLRMGSDPVCDRAHRTPVLDEALVVNEDGTLQNAFVQIKSVPGKYDPPTTAVVLDQQGCVYYPHVVGVMAGQPLVALNSDATLHNVHVMPKKNPEQNISQPAKGMRSVIVFKTVEENILVKCDVHAWMNSRVHVTAHPFFSVSDVEGRFEIRGLPPGRYELEVIHELNRIARQTIEIEVKADTSTRLDVTMK